METWQIIAIAIAVGALIYVIIKMAQVELPSHGDISSDVTNTPTDSSTTEQGGGND